MQHRNESVIVVVVVIDREVLSLHKASPFPTFGSLLGSNFVWLVLILVIVELRHVGLFHKTRALAALASLGQDDRLLLIPRNHLRRRLRKARSAGGPVLD